MQFYMALYPLVSSKVLSIITPDTPVQSHPMDHPKAQCYKICNLPLMLYISFDLNVALTLNLHSLMPL